MQYDDRYTPYIRMTRLLPFINSAKDRVSKMNACLIIALVEDRWRPETHTFHLPCGEMTFTLQDVSMIMALPIGGQPICWNTDSAGWLDKMTSYLGKEPGLKYRAAGASFGWICKSFGKCPAEYSDEVVEMHARAYLWVVLCHTVFGDSGGSNVPYFWLELLADCDYRWSWGTVALAWLYRRVSTLCIYSCHVSSNLLYIYFNICFGHVLNLNDACHKISAKKEANIGGCMVLLSVWSWEHFLIGRPLPESNIFWDEGRDRDRMPTWILRWYKFNRDWGSSTSLYLDYTSVDMLHHSMVTWEPYGEAGNMGGMAAYALNPACLAEAHLWRMECPLICFYSVEMHLPKRVMRQFGLFQRTPVPYTDTVWTRAR